jgi:hypothetical protein
MIANFSSLSYAPSCPLNEAVETQHLQHIEDLMFQDLENGIADSFQLLNDITKSLASKTPTAKMVITTKWDGAPAIVAGKHPSNSKFFVALKHATTSKNPKINFTLSDIKKNHGDSPDLVEKLSMCLQHLPEVMPATGVYQGDLMFSTSSRKEMTIDGVKNIVFRPNTILYAVPAESPLGMKIAAAKIGIVFHTVYTGKGSTLQELNKGTLSSLDGFKQSTNVWYSAATLPSPPTGKTFVTASDAKQITELLKMAKPLAAKTKAFLKIVAKSHKTGIFNELMPFINSGVRAGLSKYDSSKLKTHIAAKHDLAISKVSTPKAKESKTKTKMEVLKFIDAYASQFDQLFQLHSLISEAKMIVVKRLSEVKTIGTYLPTNKGIKATNPEGFVAVCGDTCQMIKLVDRIEFARANFNLAKDWKL